MLLALLALPLTALVAQTNPRPLTGVTKLTVSVSLDVDDKSRLPSGITQDRLRTIVELRLRTAALRVLSAVEAAADPQDIPDLEVRIHMLGAWAGQAVERQTGYAFSVESVVLMAGRLPSTGAMAPHLLWSDTNLNISSIPDASAAVEGSVNSLLDNFANEWLPANPPKRP